ncbi:MAG: hypothetical protein HC836_34540 [Richelia sp. RM2_1_2]|nr:hypothetical protein [Richelia sp. RM1_1_1]NJO63155.1 hypothetical protein [Richelia sp. RM2_1_2]
MKSGSVAASSISANINSSPFLYSNPNRKGATIWNNSTSNLFIDFDTEATTTEYAVKIPSHGYFELPFNYVGPIAGVWEVADGQAFIREFN